MKIECSVEEFKELLKKETSFNKTKDLTIKLDNKKILTPIINWNI